MGKLSFPFHFLCANRINTQRGGSYRTETTAERNRGRVGRAA